MSDEQMNLLVRIAADTAMRAAADYVRLHEATVSDYNLAAQVLRAEVHLAMDQALAEVREAFACRMDQVAIATFKASMMAAGIKAAKQFTEAA